MKHEVNRHVEEVEKNLWLLTKRHAQNDPGAARIPIAEMGSNRLPIDHTRGKQIVATWANEGLIAKEGPNGGYLTEYGRQVEQIEEDRVTGESWR